MKWLLPIALLGLLAGCASQKTAPRPAAPASQAPAWYLHPPPNDSDHLFGLGEGATMEEATKKALANLTERVAVEVKSRWRSEERSVDDGAYESIARKRRHTVETIGAALPLSGYAVARSARLAWDRYLVLVQVSRSAVAHTLRRRVEEGLKNAETLATNAHDDPFRRYRTAQQAAKGLEALRPDARLLAHLSPGDAPLEEKVAAKARTLRAAARKARQNVHLCQKGPQTLFLQAAENFFAAQGFPVARGPECPAGALRLVVLPDFHADRLHDFFIVKGSATLALYAGDTPVLSRRFRIKGVSSQTQKRALRRAVENFYETLVKNLLL